MVKALVCAALLLLQTSTTVYAQPIAVVRLEGSRFACGRTSDGKTALLRITHSGHVARSFKIVLAERSAKLTSLRNQIARQQLLLKKRGARVTQIRKRIKDLRTRRNAVRREITFIVKCRNNQIPFDSGTPTTPTPTPTAAPPSSPTPTVGFLNFESMPVNPMTRSLDGTRLLAVNTADSRLEIFRIEGNDLVWEDSIFTGLDPVSVRLQNATTAWVVNKISRTVSIIDLAAKRVVRTLHTGDAPTDVAFASGRAFVTNSGENRLQVFALADLAASPTTVPIRGVQPHALGVTAAGQVVGLNLITTDTALASRLVVNLEVSPYGGRNPVPNAGTGFFPPVNPSLPPPPETGLIVQRQPDGRYLDEQGANWTSAPWIEPEDNDVFSIDPNTLVPTYRQLNLTQASALGLKLDGTVTVAGTEARNLRRFEPNLNGDFARIAIASLDLASGQSTSVSLNPHLTFAPEQIEAQGDMATYSEALRRRSLANPAAVVWTSNGSRGFVVGQGSDNVVAISASGARVAGLQPLPVGAGPAGLTLDEARSRLYVYNAHENSISVIDPVAWQVVREVSFFDPTPAVIRAGRPLLYNAHRTSGMGIFSCATCHVNARTDFLNWDLGNPAGELVTITQSCLVPPEQGGCVNHPLKGPLLTQTLDEIIGKGPLHWRGDKNNIREFNGAFSSLLGSPRELTSEEMGIFEAYLDTISVPPSPYRTVEDALRTDLDGGNPQRGHQIFMAACHTCHRLEAGGRGAIVANMATPQGGLRSQLFLDGPMVVARVDNVRSRLAARSNFEPPYGRSVVPLGFMHNGSTTSDGFFGGFLREVIGFGAGLPPAQIGQTPETDQAIRDMVAFIQSFPVRTHAGVGATLTVTVPGLSSGDAGRIAEMLAASATGKVGVIAKTRRVSTGREEGFLVTPQKISADRAGVEFTFAQFFEQYSGLPVTLMVVPANAAKRLGIDRNINGVPDGDE